MHGGKPDLLQQDLFDELFDAVPDCLAIVDHGLKLVRVNSAMSFQHQRPARSFGGQTVEEVLPAMAADIEPLVLRALAGETIRGAVVSTGDSDSVSASFVPVLSDGGSIDGALIILGQGRESEGFTRDRLELTLSGTQVGTFEWSPATSMLRWSDGLGPLFGRPVGWTPDGYEEYAELVHEDDRATLRGDVQLALADGTGYDREFRCIWPDGSVHWLHSRVQAISDGGSRTLLGFVTDIDGRKRRQESAALLAQVSAGLGMSLELDETVQGLADALVGTIADWGEVVLVDDRGDLDAVTVAHTDPALLPVAQQVQRVAWNHPAAAHQLELFRSGKTVVRSALDKDLIQELAVNEEHLRLVLQLAPRAGIAVPMIARGRLLGAILLFSQAPDAFDDPLRIELVEEVGRRAAFAVDNARLWEAQHRANRALERLQAVTDAALDNLELDDLLEELLRRVTEMTVAEFAVVLLSDPDRGDLVLRAANGLPGASEKEIRLAPGEGIAGIVFQTGEPLYVEDLEAAEYRSLLGEHLRRQVRSVLAVPLLADGTLVGVLQVGALSRTRSFKDPDVELLRLVAERAGRGIVHASVFSQARETSSVLQASLLPSSLPVIDGFELEAMYRPGQALFDVGGDWYDAFALDDGRFAIAVGDVVGRGVRAAALMGQLRAGTRAYAREHDDPAVVLSNVDKLVEDLVAVPFATMVLLMLDPATGVVHLSSAGHPPPVLRSTGMLNITGAPALGAPVTNPRITQRFQIQPGDTFVAYTDGMVELRSESLQSRLDKLAATVQAGPAEPVALLAHLEDEMLGHDSRDDTAAVALRRTA